MTIIKYYKKSVLGIYSLLFANYYMQNTYIQYNNPYNKTMRNDNIITRYLINGNLGFAMFGSCIFIMFWPLTLIFSNEPIGNLLSLPKYKKSFLNKEIEIKKYYNKKVFKEEVIPSTKFILYDYTDVQLDSNFHVRYMSDGTYYVLE